MISLDALLLSRIQFAINIGFHSLFTTISIALAWALVFFRLRAQKTAWASAYAFWVKIFALTFALGVVSGVTMSFQFGTNWPGFMNYAGNIAGPLLAYEILTAFFLEATFLGIMLFGAGRVRRSVQTLAAILVALGTTLSAFWILALNAWMHTPSGYVEHNGVLYADNWRDILFSPSLPLRFMHTLLASALTVAFLLAGVSAYRWLRGNREESVEAVMKWGVQLAACLIPLQVLVGDLHGLTTYRYQPAKIAAVEGIWQTARSVPAILWGWPDEAAGKTHGAFELPGLASLILTHSWHGEIQGLAAFKHPPPVLPVFVAFRVMVGVALLMWLTAWAGVWCFRGQRMPPQWFARILVAMTFAGWIAMLAGWCVTEIGRQPYLIYGLLLTRDAASTVPAAQVVLSLAGYLMLSLLLLLAYIATLFFLARQADKPGRVQEESQALVETPLPVLPTVQNMQEPPDA